MLAPHYVMTESEFNTKVDGVLLDIEQSLEAANVDADFEFGEGILQISFPDGGKLIVNRQAVNREIWVAARSGGYHFAWNGKGWYGTRDGRELFAVLSECASQQSGGTIIIGR